MTSISGKISCAKRGGPTFLETVRVDPITLKCPEGLVPCSLYTDATDTVCMEPNLVQTECPIIDVFVMHEDLIPYLTQNGFEVTE